MAKKVKTANQRAYEKELNRIKRFVKRAEKRGFRFDKSVIPEKPKRYTQKRIEELKEKTATKLYKQATYLDPDTGKVVSGARGRTIERSKSAKKGRKRKIRVSAQSKIMENVRSMIDMYPTAGAIYLNKLLKSQIAKYGEEVVARSLAMAGEDLVQQLQEIVFYQGNSNQHHRALRAFAETLLGNIPDDAESREIGEVLEQMEDMWDDTQ